MKMRSKKGMFELLPGYAKTDERIRAVVIVPFRSMMWYNWAKQLLYYGRNGD